MLLDRTSWLVKETAFKKYDILDPFSGQLLAAATTYRAVPDSSRTADPAEASLLESIKRYILKSIPVLFVEILEGQKQPPVIALREMPSFFANPKVHVLDSEGYTHGYFAGKSFSLLGHNFGFYDPQNHGKIASMEADWKAWNFKLMSADGQQFGTMTKKWADIKEELFMSGANYLVSVTLSSPSRELCALVLAAGLALNVFYKPRMT